MKKTTLLIGLVGILAGCTLNQQVPKATISLNPATKQVDIASHKDVKLNGVTWVEQTGTNYFHVDSYEAQANIEVIKAAVQAQQQQIQGANDMLMNILTAIGGTKAGVAAKVVTPVK